MCNRLSRRNRPWVYPQTQEEQQRQQEWKHDWIHGKNKYRLHMLEEAHQASNKMFGDDTCSNIVKNEIAQKKGKNHSYIRPSVQKHVSKLDRYWLATYNGKLNNRSCS